LFDATITHAAAWAAMPAAILLGITGALALACFVKVCSVVFLGAPRSAAALHAHEAGPAMRGAMLSLALCCAVIGLAPAFFWPAMLHAVNAWNPNWQETPIIAPLGALGAFNMALAVLALLAAAWLWRKVARKGMRRAVTWDCGYAAPSPRMQYTAGSFAAIINEWFAWILRPIRHENLPEGPFPREASFSSHTPETVLENVVEPGGSSVLQVAMAARRLQRGRVQAYLLYLLIGIGALALIVSPGGRN
jgi:hydrogenase-4 component B